MARQRVTLDYCDVCGARYCSSPECGQVLRIERQGERNRRNAANQRASLQRHRATRRKLYDAALTRVLRACRALHEAWSAAGRPDFERYLAPLQPNGTPLTLKALAGGQSWRRQYVGLMLYCPAALDTYGEPLNARYPLGIVYENVELQEDGRVTLLQRTARGVQRHTDMYPHGIGWLIPRAEVRNG